MKRIVVGVTGASGSLYAVKMVEQLLLGDWFVHLVFSDNGRHVFSRETGLDVPIWYGKLKDEHGAVALEDNNNLFSPIASGSFSVNAVVIVPCSMSTLGEIAGGTGKSLLCRAVDVALKESRRLLLIPRETPLNAVHLENMLKLVRLGVGILPAMPGFYNRPETVEDMVSFVAGKALDWLGVENGLYGRWEG
jgi:4-hydroxy-3-polyprenylbenzoate decarboxylase